MFRMKTPVFGFYESIRFNKSNGFSMSYEHLYFSSSDVIGKYASKYGLEVVCALFGGGDGRPCVEANQRNIRNLIKGTLASMRLLESSRELRTTVRQAGHDYQAKRARRNILMILGKRLT